MCGQINGLPGTGMKHELLASPRSQLGGLLHFQVPVTGGPGSVLTEAVRIRLTCCSLVCAYNSASGQSLRFFTF